MLEEGAKAPPFTLPDHHGDPVSLDEMAGKWVILWWFVKASTSG